MHTKSSMSSLACFSIVFVFIMALTTVKGELNEQLQKANLVNDELEQLLEKRFSPRQFAFAKRGIRNFAFAKRSFDDSPFVRSFAFAKRSNNNFDPSSMFAIIDSKRSSPSQFGENNFARFAFAKKSLRNFAFAR